MIASQLTAEPALLSPVERAQEATVSSLSLSSLAAFTDISIGLSIGSVGGRSDNTVQTVTISSSTIKNSQNGVRIKTVYGATGSVSGVTYKDITLSGYVPFSERSHSLSGVLRGCPTLKTCLSSKDRAKDGFDSKYLPSRVILTPKLPRITKYGIVIEQDYQASNTTSQRIMKENIADLVKNRTDPRRARQRRVSLSRV
jgi:polygalacturonase